MCCMIEYFDTLIVANLRTYVICVIVADLYVAFSSLKTISRVFAIRLLNLVINISIY